MNDRTEYRDYQSRVQECFSVFCARMSYDAHTLYVPRKYCVSHGKTVEKISLVRTDGFLISCRDERIKTEIDSILAYFPGCERGGHKQSGSF